jgi:hypothetical protein
MPTAWIRQDDNPVKKPGTDWASWYVDWVDTGIGGHGNR